MDSTID